MNLNLRIEPDLLKATKAIAEANDQPLSRYVRAAIREKNARESSRKKPRRAKA